ncbi:MAG: HlyD family efflux transporter periplasmic adaptor subunit [Saprospiraceae bacterium]|nr:HlyD family efflux transporter periplasmic adaptor subunit [Saprospiraceae bacterium]
MSKAVIKHVLVLLMLSGMACTSEIREFDASGTFEATEIIVSAQATGAISSFTANEGDHLQAGDSLIKIDATQLSLQKGQLVASIEAVRDKQGDAGPQIDVLQEKMMAANSQVQTLETQLETQLKELKRIEKMYRAEAATEQQYDRTKGQVDVLRQQIAASKNQVQVIDAQMDAAKRSVAIQNRGITSEIKPLEKKINLLDDQLAKSVVINPINGTLLTKYAYQGEFVSIGKPLYKIADLRIMALRAYVDGTQLNQIKLGEEVDVYIDQGNDHKAYQGKITWVSDRAEFTPKTIQTKDERANLVYAIKIQVPNDGYLKIGMYAEVALPKADEIKE